MKTSRLTAAAGVGAVTVLALATPSFAHVSVAPEGTAAKGGYAVVDFKVPNERDDASTTKIEVSFPADHPLASVLAQPMPGWKVDITRSKLAEPLDVHGRKIDEAVSKVTWTAAGKGIEPGYFQKFPLSVGALPEDTDELVFKAVQTYSDNEVVRWIEVRKDGQEEPENPAPVLALSAASDDGHGHGTTTAEDASATTEATTEATATATTAATGAAADSVSSAAGSSGSDTTARVLGVTGIVLGAAGVAYGVLAGRRRTAA